MRKRQSDVPQQGSTEQTMVGHDLRASKTTQSQIIGESFQTKDGYELLWILKENLPIDPKLIKSTEYSIKADLELLGIHCGQKTSVRSTGKCCRDPSHLIL